MWDAHDGAAGRCFSPYCATRQKHTHLNDPSERAYFRQTAGSDGRNKLCQQLIATPLKCLNFGEHKACTRPAEGQH